MERSEAPEAGGVEQPLEAAPPTSRPKPITLSTPTERPVATISYGLTTSEQKVLDALARSRGCGGNLEDAAGRLRRVLQSEARGLRRSRRSSRAQGHDVIERWQGHTDDSGRGAANQPGRPATTRDLRERIFSLLGEGERKLLTLLIAAHPESLERVELARQGGYSNAKSGGSAAPLARLIEVGFVDAVKNGFVRGSEMMFLKGKVRSR